MYSGTDRTRFTNVERLQRLVVESGLDAVLATSFENVTYASAFYRPSGRIITEMMDTVVWPAEGKPVFIVDQGHSGAETLIEDIRTYNQWGREEVVKDPRGRSLAGFSPMPLVADALREKGLAAGRVGLEKVSFPARCYEELQELMPSAEFVDCGSLFDEARMLKTAAEIELLQSAGIATEKAIQIGLELARPGDTSRNLANAIGSAITQLGAEMVAFLDLDVMRDGRLFDYLKEPVELKEGDLLRIDVGGYFAGYCSDIARMAVVGQPNSDQRSGYQRLCSVQRKMIEEVFVPGRSGSEVLRLTSKVFEEFGFPSHWRYAFHGIGLSLHERPWPSKVETYELQPGMVLCIEAGASMARAVKPGEPVPEEKWHVEDLILITEEAARELTTYSPTEELFIIG